MKTLVCVFRVKLLEALIGIFELPEDDALPDGEHFIEVDDTGEIPKQVCDVFKVTRVIKVMLCLSTPTDITCVQFQ